VTVSEQSHSGTEAYEVAVAVVPIEQNVKEGNQQTPGVPGFDEAWGRSSGDHAAGRSILIEKGETAVRTATEAIASQIGIAAQRIAESIENQSWPTAQPGSLGLQTVEITFGVTLSAGIQTLFTAQADSSAQVTITLSR
jgi:hypothetical protein